MQQLVVRFNDFLNSGRVIRGVLSRARGRDVQVSVDGNAYRPARFGRSVGFIHKHAVGQGLVLISFEEIERGVYEARYASKEAAWNEHQEARWATGYNVFAFDGGLSYARAYRAG
jgi:hypothetical protein